MTPIDSISLHRGPCLGSCPVYTVTVARGGYASWRGEFSVEPLGDLEATVDQSEFYRLADLLLDLGFLTWRDAPPTMTCNADHAITVIGDGAAKTITQWAGGITPEFNKAAEAIDEVARSLGWAGGG
jgi:hypothetical protein